MRNRAVVWTLLIRVPAFNLFRNPGREGEIDARARWEACPKEN